MNAKFWILTTISNPPESCVIFFRLHQTHTMAHLDGYIIAFKYKICLRQVDNNCTSKNVPLGLTFSITADDDSEGAEITKNPWRLAVNAASGRWCIYIVVVVLCVLFVVSRLTKKKMQHGTKVNYIYIKIRPVPIDMPLKSECVANGWKPNMWWICCPNLIVFLEHSGKI